MFQNGLSGSQKIHSKKDFSEINGVGNFISKRVFWKEKNAFRKELS